MGWAHCGTDSKGREIGYAISATCDHKGCKEKIDRGLGYACGGMHGAADEYCEGYFCETHTEFRFLPSEERGQRLCFHCAASLDEAKLEDYQDVMLDFLRKPEAAHHTFRKISDGVKFRMLPDRDIIHERDVLRDGTLVGRIECAKRSTGESVWSFHSVDGTLTMGLGSRSLGYAIGRFTGLMEPRVIDASAHKRAIYELMLRWDDVEKLPLDPDFMTEKQIDYVGRRQQSLAEIRKLAHAS